MSRAAVFSLLLLAPVASNAKVYRWVDAEGRVTFSDRPAIGAEAFPAPETAAPAPEVPAQPADSPDSPLLGPYRAFAVASPEAGQTIRQAKDGDRLPLSLVLDPPLQEGHRLEITMDGAPILLATPGTQLAVSGVSYGSHRVQGIVRDLPGTVVARTAPVDFHFLKPIPPGVLQ